MWPNPLFLADLVTFTEEILNEKLHFLCSVRNLKKTKNLDTAKASQESDILIKNFSEGTNYCICHSISLSSLKSADVRPVYNQNSKKSKENYRPISILSNVSKVYERCLYNQMQNYFENVLSKYQCGFYKGYNTQRRLVVLFEKW